jgi:hypothetical protein
MEVPSYIQVFPTQQTSASRRPPSIGTPGSPSPSRMRFFCSLSHLFSFWFGLQSFVGYGYGSQARSSSKSTKLFISAVCLRQPLNSNIRSRNTPMKHDRVATIPVRHRFADYQCTIAYSEYEDEFHLVEVRSTAPESTGQPKNSFDIYLRVLKEPALRANLFEALVPDQTAKISELREEALSERAKGYGFAVGFAALCATGYALCLLTRFLAGYIGYDTAELITYLPTFFAFLIVFPVQHFVAHWYRRRYCIQHSHRLETFKAVDEKMVTWCKRCGLRIKAQDAKPTNAPSEA